MRDFDRALRCRDRLGGGAHRRLPVFLAALARLDDPREAVLGVSRALVAGHAERVAGGLRRGGGCLCRRAAVWGWWRHLGFAGREDERCTLRVNGETRERRPRDERRTGPN